MYIALRQYGSVLSIAGKSCSRFVLARTKRTEQLTTMRAFRCGENIVPIRWNRDSAADTAADHLLALMELPTAAVPPAVSHEALNDDCFREILSERVLEVGDFCAIAQTGSRFRGLARDAFRRRFGRPSFEIDSLNWSIPRCEALFRHFGDLIDALEITNYPSVAAFEDIVLAMVGYYCRPIVRIKCGRLAPIGEAVARHRRLQSLSGQDYGPAPFGRLQQLDYEGSEHMPPHLSLPALRSFHLAQPWLVDRRATEAFFSAHPHIDSLTLSLPLMRFPVDAILRHLPHLRRLHMIECRWPSDDGAADADDCDPSHTCFGRLQCLKEFSCPDTDSLAMLRAMCEGHVRLERLQLSSYIFPDCVKRMDSLKWLDFSAWSTAALVDLANYLQTDAHLEEICVRSRGLTFDMIRDIVRLAPAHLKAATFHIRLNGLASNFITDNQSQIDALDGALEARPIRLRVELKVLWMKKKLMADVEAINRSSTWLHISKRLQGTE